MAAINYSTRSAEIKIVLYGAAYAGKTTTLQYIHGRLDPSVRGKFTSDLAAIGPKTDRTLFFEVFGVQPFAIQNLNVRFKLWTLPGQPTEFHTREVVLRKADAVSFIVDSQYDRASANVESFLDLQENLKKHDQCLKGFENDPGNAGLDPIPFVLFYNKRDLGKDIIVPVSYLDLMFEVQNRNLLRYYGSCVTGENVFRAANMLLYRAVEDGLLSKLRARGALPQASA